MSRPVGRPRDPNSEYRIFLHKNGKYTYASTNRAETDPQTGREHRRIVHWGTVDEENVFRPNSRYLYLSLEERARFIWPENWNLGELAKLPSERKAGRPACEQNSSRFYGDIWLLEQIAEKTGVMQDLRIAFDGHEEMVQDILSLAMFLYLSKQPYSHMRAWQNLGKFPSVHSLEPSVITRLAQSITEEHKQVFCARRARRAGKSELCAVDSTTRRAFGTHLAEITCGKNKDDGLTVPQTIEVIVYTLTRHEPVYYLSFAGNMSDKRTLPFILRSLEQAGFRDLIVITDRGYDGTRSLDYCILHHQQFVSAVPVRRKFLIDRIDEMGQFGMEPPNMQWLPGKKLFGQQYDMVKTLRGKGGRTVTSDRLRVNLYFDPKRRAEQTIAMQNEIASQQKALEQIKSAGTPLPANKLKEYNLFLVTRNEQTHAVEAFERDVGKIRQKERFFGFFAIQTHKIDLSVLETLETYSLRDEQEKYFFQVKTQLAADTQRCSSDRSRDGRRFIEFVSTILVSNLSYTWRSSRQLRQLFPYVFAMAEEMRRIRYIEHPGRQKLITPFVSKQVTICQEFGFVIPKGCEPEYESPVVKTGKKRGRPRKNKSQTT